MGFRPLLRYFSPELSGQFSASTPGPPFTVDSDRLESLFFRSIDLNQSQLCELLFWGQAL